jgi:hypothetical protein
MCTFISDVESYLITVQLHYSFINIGVFIYIFNYIYAKHLS